MASLQKVSGTLQNGRTALFFILRKTGTGVLCVRGRGRGHPEKITRIEMFHPFFTLLSCSCHCSPHRLPSWVTENLEPTPGESGHRVHPGQDGSLSQGTISHTHTAIRRVSVDVKLQRSIRSSQAWFKAVLPSRNTNRPGP